MADSLSLIAANYESDEEESPEIIEVLPTKAVEAEQEKLIIKDQNVYRNVQSSGHTSSEDTESSSDESSSSSSSSSDSSSSDSSSVSSSESEEKINRDKKSQNSRKSHYAKGEYDDLPPIEDLQISVPEVLCELIGEVGWIVEQMVVVTPKPQKPTLNIDTILFVDHGQRVLGKVFDVFGPVAEPHYCVRFNDAEHIKTSNINPGIEVYYCPNTQYTNVVFMKDLVNVRAKEDTDEDEHPEFSDDEKEKAYYQALAQKKAASRTSATPKVSLKRARLSGNTEGRSNNPWLSHWTPHQYFNQATSMYPSYPTSGWPQHYNNQPYMNPLQTVYRWPNNSPQFPKQENQSCWATQPPPPPPGT